MSLEITSPAFDSGETIPTEYTCEGQNVSPPLSWHGIPEQTDNLVLLCDDPDAQPGPSGPFTHWVLYNLPADVKKIPEGFSSEKESAGMGTKGKNSFGNTNYEGPCPPSDKPHRYVFRLYALKDDPGLPPNANREQVLQGIKDYILDQAVYLGQYGSAS